MSKKFKVLSLFSSTGIAEFGFNQNRFNIVLANELLEYRADAHTIWHPVFALEVEDFVNNYSSKNKKK